MLVAVRYLLMFGVISHSGSLTRASHPVSLASSLRSSGLSKSDRKQYGKKIRAQLDDFIQFEAFKCLTGLH